MLEVMIPTWGPDGINRIAAMNLPSLPGKVCYTLSWQRSGSAPLPEVLASRPDIRVMRIESIGLSPNRNNLLANAREEMLLTGDDDLVYTPERLLAVIDCLEAHPEVEVATFCHTGTGKIYPAASFDLGRPAKGYYVTSFEIALRRNERTSLLRYDERFGLSSPRLHACEEELFVLEAMRKGLRGRFFPITICEHNGLTTGTEPVVDPGVVQAMGAYLLIYKGWLQLLPRVALKAWRLSKSGKFPFFRSVWHLFAGVRYLISHPKTNPEQ